MTGFKVVVLLVKSFEYQSQTIGWDEIIDSFE